MTPRSEIIRQQVMKMRPDEIGFFQTVRKYMEPDSTVMHFQVCDIAVEMGLTLTETWNIFWGMRRKNIILPSPDGGYYLTDPREAERHMAIEAAKVKAAKHGIPRKRITF